MSADLNYAQVLGRIASEPQNRVRIAARRTDDGSWAHTMLDVVTEEAAIPRIWEYPTALVVEFGADGKDVAAAFDECMIVHAGHRLAGPPTAAAKPSGAAGSSGAWSASRATSAATSRTPKRKRFKTAMLQTAHRLSTELVPLM